MKKRIIEAVFILAAVIVAFFLLNISMDFFSDNPLMYEIDGEYYSAGDKNISLTLMTEEGLENLSKLDRMESLSISPYKYKITDSLTVEDEAFVQDISKQTEEVFSYCTDLEDISFLGGITWLKKLSIEGCKCSDISCLSEMAELTSLNIKNTEVTDLSVLSKLNKLEILNIENIPAEDISAVMELKSLKKLYVSKGQLSDGQRDELKSRGVEITVENEETDEK